jgi:uroporphyrinogen-III synthase
MSKRILYLGLDPTHYACKGEVFHWPIIQIIPRPLSEPSVQQALHHFQQYSHVIITSKSTVAILKDYLARLGIELQIWKQKTTLAVGQVTAKHLEACGIKPAKVAQEETAEGMIHELAQMSLEDAHVFWPHSAQARPVIKDFLVNRHIRHTTCQLYDTKSQVPGALPNLADFDEIVFTSPSTIEAFLQIFGTFPSQIELVAIGPITARFLEAQQKLNNLD